MRKIASLLSVLMLVCALAFGQTRTVSGTVRDDKGDPIPFATVTVAGTNTATQADASGRFTLNNVAENARLTISSTGFTSQTIEAGADLSGISLARTNAQLSEVVVTALGIRRQAKNVGYSTATVSNRELNVSKPVNVAQGLVGRVAGAQISTINNGVNPDVRIQLRGERHINADNQALVVVDGMIVRADYLSSINPEDIDNVSILKGATAAALYGAEATNGVMIVTTRRGGERGRPSITFSTTNTIEKLSYLPKLQKQFSGYGGETGTFFYGPAVNPYTGFASYAPFENQSYGPEFNGDPALGFIGGPNEQGNIFKTPFSAASPDPREAFFKTGFTSQNDLSYSGGDRDNSYFIGIQDVNIKGTLPKDISRRTSARFGGRRTYGIFSADFNMSYALKSSNTAGEDPNGGFPVYWSLLNTPANIPITQLKNWQDPTSFGNLSNYYNAYYTNPYWIIDNARHLAKSDNLQGGLTFNLKPVDWFNATYRVGAQITNTRYKDHRNPALFSAYAQGDPWGASSTASSGNIAGTVNDADYYFRRLQQDVFLTFNKKFGDITSTLILGNTIWDRYSSIQSAGSNSTYLTDLFNIGYRQGEAIVSQSESNTRLIGGYGDLTLGYKDFLTVHGNFRRDWSSLLAKENHAYNVYAVDAALVLSDLMESIKNSNVISFAKIRAAYSHTGQITIDPYSITNSYDVANGFPYGSLAALSVNGTFNNPSLVPEQTIEKEGGIELGFFKNRLNVEATYYHDNNTAQTFPVNISSSTGYLRATVNAGETMTSGWEFTVKAAPVVRKNGLRWDIGANLSIMKSNVVSLLAGTQQFDIGNYNFAIVGRPFPYMQLSDLERDSATGKVIVDATTGLPKQSANVVPVGQTTPKYILGLNTSVAFKGLTLTVIGDYRAGYVFYANVGQNLDFTGASLASTTNGRQSFIYPNSVYEDPSGKIVNNNNVYIADGSLGFWVSSDYRKAGTSYLMNAAAWKLRVVSLAYDINRVLNNRIKFIKGATINLIGNDLLMFRPKQNTWTDPEFNNNNSNGLGYTTYYQLPPTRKMSVQLSVNF